MWIALAWTVVVLHALYLVFQMCGGMLAFRNPRWLYLHGMAVTWGVVIVVMGWRCPLTESEKWLRSQGGQTPYEGSYLDHYLFGRFLPDGSQALVYGLHLLVILAIYVVLLRIWLTSRRTAMT